MRPEVIVIEPVRRRLGLIGAVSRGVPPGNCGIVCPEYLGEICATCVKRPIKEVTIDYGNEPDLETAIQKGLTTPLQIEIFLNQITSHARIQEEMVTCGAQ